MSELTPCNYCTLQRMKREAKKRKTKVIVFCEITGEWKGWTTAYYKDTADTGNAARFMKLTDHCVC